jgi:serine/threonine protein kinase
LPAVAVDSAPPADGSAEGGLQQSLHLTVDPAPPADEVDVPPPSLHRPRPPPSALLSEWLVDFTQTRLVRVLGEGSTWTVELREDASFHDLLAVKSLKAASQQSSDITTSFMNEMAIMVRMQHPCVLSIVGYSLPTGSSPAQIGCEFAAHGDLGVLLEQRRRGAAPTFADDTGMAIILCGIVLGMRFLHAHAVMHRDLKPANILIGAGGRPKIGDFGRSRLTTVDLTLTHQVGTPLYMAPEMYKDGDYTSAVDVYSFGLILYECLVGRPVFPLETALYPLIMKVTGGERPPIPETLDPAIGCAIARAWSVDPGDRPTFADLADTFAQLDFKLTPSVDVRRVRAYVGEVLAAETASV